MSIATESPATVVVAFEDRGQADQAVAELRRAGFRAEAIRIEESPIVRTDAAPGRAQVLVAANGRAAEAEAILCRLGEAEVIVPAPRAPVCEMAAPPSAEDGQTLQLREERLEARTWFVETGAVRVRKEVVTEHQTLEVPVIREEFVLERKAPTGAPVAVADFGPAEEIRIVLRKEQVAVEKRPVVKEEVTVGRRIVQETRQVGGEVRREELRVEHQDKAPASSAPGDAASAEAEVRCRAYLKWLAEGRPAGEDRRHYFEARRELQG